MSSVLMEPCRVCGKPDRLSRCSRCHKVNYCSKEHQKADWKTHKKNCKPVEIENDVKNLNLQDCKVDTPSVNTLTRAHTAAAMPVNNAGQSGAVSSGLSQTHQWSASNSIKLEDYMPEEVTEADNGRAQSIFKSLQDYGLIMLNNFLPKDQAEEVRQAICSLYEAPENFVDGEIVKQGSNLGPERVRGDRIRWIDEAYSGCKALRIMCKKLDKLVHLVCKIASWKIESRTKPMVACYPGNASCYKRHVDNPAGDGRLLTCLYYINKDWNTKVDGGALCLYPQGKAKNYKVICEPIFNRLCIFFSDSRNPHEVLPAHKQRFAVTCWYFDSDERKRALDQWAERAKMAATKTS